MARRCLPALGCWARACSGCARVADRSSSCAISPFEGSMLRPRAFPHVRSGELTRVAGVIPLPPNHDSQSGSPLFWTVWHALAWRLVLAVPAYYQWGESVASVPLAWMPLVLAMGAAYLGLATVVALVRPEGTLRGVLDVVVAGASVYGAALVLLSFRPDIPVSPPVVAMSMLLAISLALLPILLQRRRSLRLRDSRRSRPR